MNNIKLEIAKSITYLMNEQELDVKNLSLFFQQRIQRIYAHILYFYILHIRNRETGEDVFRIPIADYALLVKGYYRQDMGDQEYLDRQDEYTMTFFLDEGEWVSSVIYINSWRVVLNNTELN